MNIQTTSNSLLYLPPPPGVASRQTSHLQAECQVHSLRPLLQECLPRPDQVAQPQQLTISEGEARHCLVWKQHLLAGSGHGYTVTGQGVGWIGISYLAFIDLVSFAKMLSVTSLGVRELRLGATFSPMLRAT